MSTTMPETATATEAAAAQTTEAATTATEGAEQAQAGTATQAAAQTAAEAPAWGDAWDGKVESLPTAVQKMIRDERKAEGDERVAKKTLEAIQKALNPDAAGEKVDPAQLAADLQAKDATIRDLTIKSALNEALHTHSAKPIARAAILGDEVLKDLDATAATFAADVDAAVKAYIEKNPELKAPLVAGQSSVDHAGGSGEGDHTLDAQIADAEKKGDHALAIQLKRQRAYGGKQ